MLVKFTHLEKGSQFHYWCAVSLVTQSCPTLCDDVQYSPWNSPGKNPGVGCHFLLQGIFPTEGLDLGLLHWRQNLYPLSHQGSPNCKHHFSHQSCLTLYDPMDCSTPGFTVYHQLPELIQTHVHRVVNAIQTISSSVIRFSSLL